MAETRLSMALVVGGCSFFGLLFLVIDLFAYLCRRMNQNIDNKFPPLALPDAALRLRRVCANSAVAGVFEVFDTQRRRWVRLTPEEWVRQHFVSYLLSHLGYPRGLVSNEVCIRVGQTEKRCDTVVYVPCGEVVSPVSPDRATAPHEETRLIAEEANRPARGPEQFRPLMIVEYKAPSVPLTNRVFRQVLRYDTALQVPLLAVSNGLHHYCCRIEAQKRRFVFLQEFPRYEEALRLLGL